MLEVIPCHPLGLTTERGNVGVLRHPVALSDCPFDDVVDGCDCLASPSVSH